MAPSTLSKRKNTNPFKLLTIVRTQWLFDMSCSDCLCGAFVEHYHSLSKTNKWRPCWFFLVCLCEGSMWAVRSVSMWTGIFLTFRTLCLTAMIVSEKPVLWFLVRKHVLCFFCTFPLWGTHSEQAKITAEWGLTSYRQRNGGDSHFRIAEHHSVRVVESIFLLHSWAKYASSFVIS